MSSSINLDFQDYSPTSSSGNFSPTGQVQGDSNPTQHYDPSAKARHNASSSKSIFNFSPEPSKLSGGFISGETLQQLMWLTDKQRSKEQRDTITAGTNWGLGYLARYFDITTQDVLGRIIWSAVPIRKTGLDLDNIGSTADLLVPLASHDESSGSPLNMPNQAEGFADRLKHYSYMERFIQSRPDFYGPFWISTTLIFAIAIFSNIVSFIDFQSKSYGISQFNPRAENISDSGSTMVRLEEPTDWHYSVNELNMAATLIVSYVIMVPTILWFIFWFRGCTKYYTLTETVCAYGYSLSIFVPLSALLMLQNAILRYIVFLTGASLSGIVLLMSFLPVVKSDPSSGGSHIILIMVASCHLGLAYLIHRIMLQ